MDFLEFTTIDEVGEDDSNPREENNEFYRSEAWIQQTFERIRDVPFMGLQYVVEVRKTTDPTLDNCSYVCCLCSKKTSSTTLLAHVKSVPHRLKYTKAHQPSIFEKYGNIEVKGWTAVLVKDFTRSLKACESDSHQMLATVNEGELTRAVAFLKATIDSKGQESLEEEEKRKTEPKVLSVPVNNTHQMIQDILIDLTCSPSKKRNRDSSVEKNSTPTLKQRRSSSPSRVAGKQNSERSRLSDVGRRSRSRERFRDRRRSRSKSPFRKLSPRGPRRHGSRSPLRRAQRSPPKRSPPMLHSRSPRRSWRPNSRSPPRKLDNRTTSRPGSRSPGKKDRFQPRRPSPRRLSQHSPRDRRSKLGGRRSLSRSPKRQTDRERLARERRDDREYNRELQKLKSEHRRNLEEYMAYPERYPTYTAEWGLFWERRCRELESRGEDPSFVDFKAEWVIFWKKRLKELCEKKFDDDQAELMVKYKIQDTNKSKRPSNEIPSNVLGLRTISPELNNKNRLDARNRAVRSPSPWERQPLPGQNGRFKEREEPKVSKVIEKDFSVVQTLRQLVDLEDQLGSLGSSVTELLRKVVELSVKGSDEMKLFSFADNKTLLRMCNSKLSSLLSSGVLDYMEATQTQMAVEGLQWLQKEIRMKYPSENDKVEAKFGVDIDSIARETMEMDSLGVAQHVAKHLLKVGSGDVNANDLQEILLAISAVHEKLRKCEPTIEPEDDMKFINVDHLAEKTIGMNNMEIARYIGRYLVNIGKLDADESTVQSILISVAEKHVNARYANETSKYSSKSDKSLNFEKPSNSSSVNRPALFPSGIPDSQKLDDSNSDDKNEAADDVSNSKGGLSLIQNAYEDNSNDLTKLSLEALHDMLMNFRTLGSEEQKNFTNYLKKLEATDSNKVTKLRALMQQSNKVKKETEQKASMEVAKKVDEKLQVQPPANVPIQDEQRMSNIGDSQLMAFKPVENDGSSFPPGVLQHQTEMNDHDTHYEQQPGIMNKREYPSMGQRDNEFLPGIRGMEDNRQMLGDSPIQLGRNPMNNRLMNQNDNSFDRSDENVGREEWGPDNYNTRNQSVLSNYGHSQRDSEIRHGSIQDPMSNESFNDRRERSFNQNGEERPFNMGLIQKDSRFQREADENVEGNSFNDSQRLMERGFNRPSGITDYNHGQHNQPEDEEYEQPMGRQVLPERRMFPSDSFNSADEGGYDRDGDDGGDRFGGNVNRHSGFGGADLPFSRAHGGFMEPRPLVADSQDRGDLPFVSRRGDEEGIARREPQFAHDENFAAGAEREFMVNEDDLDEMNYPMRGRSFAESEGIRGRGQVGGLPGIMGRGQFLHPSGRGHIEPSGFMGGLARGGPGPMSYRGRGGVW